MFEALRNLDIPRIGSPIFGALFPALIFAIAFFSAFFLYKHFSRGND
ncbi:MAG: hypothetical protein J7L62_07535 [Candidatus Aminicenantes bacterium]|nr:hypothetical protein [Candidatus Aminicenantes bacterium]